ncbi:hypothetical protein HK102_014118 [Quaeritorhiza haematococci]|nr:hypothetical protein HK102_014118 [Quaeritorhiza haematococci]
MVQKTTFIQKLYKILEDDVCRHLICWSATGTSFLVLDAVEFAKQVLPKVFKHNNYTSFVRQLNLYGFHKVNRSYHRHNSHESERDHGPREFFHPSFIRYRPDLLTEIRRKPSANDKGSAASFMNNNSANAPNPIPSVGDNLNANDNIDSTIIDNNDASLNNKAPKRKLRKAGSTSSSPSSNGSDSPRSESPAVPYSYPMSRSPQAAPTANGAMSSPGVGGLKADAVIVEGSALAASASIMGHSNPSMQMMQDVQSMMMKQITHLQNNVQDLMTELRDLRRRHESQQKFVDEVTELRRQQDTQQKLLEDLIRMNDNVRGTGVRGHHQLRPTPTPLTSHTDYLPAQHHPHHQPPQQYPHHYQQPPTAYDHFSQSQPQQFGQPHPYNTPSTRPTMTASSYPSSTTSAPYLPPVQQHMPIPSPITTQTEQSRRTTIASLTTASPAPQTIVSTVDNTAVVTSTQPPSPLNPQQVVTFPSPPEETTGEMTSNPEGSPGKSIHHGQQSMAPLPATSAPQEHGYHATANNNQSRFMLPPPSSGPAGEDWRAGAAAPVAYY